ncbi:hypothetical protein JCM19241_788 [Vibrio ishigakensis]|uniref:Gfo/Idh/MocA-like oxidoreductase N-terminal domain-containing protein n=1 Tax=Vibrio ishigakensis TaxID=1481914 RepID=A0A0B8QEI0_9VIBR|nr:hypothetical protein JCM19241_788 [Vibrio ishigakensis]
MRSKVLVFGGLGQPGRSVVGLYQDLLDTLSVHFDIIAIDPALYSDVEKFDFPYDQSFSSLSEYLKTHSNAKVSAAFILTPVGSHLTIIRDLSSAISIDDLLFVVEKPSFSLNEIEEGFGLIVPSLKNRGARFYFIDTALVTPAMQALLHSGLLTDRGLPHKIVAIATDNPVEIAPELDEFCFGNRIQALNERKLLSPSVSGGAGFGFDMGIHAVAGLVRYLQKSGLLKSKLEIKGVVAERVQHPQLEFEEGAETHLYANALLLHERTSIELVIEGGKAGDIWDRRLELHYDDGVIAVGFGTLKHPPYLWVSNSGVQTFDVSGAGYRMHFNDILHALGLDKPSILSCEESEELMTSSMVLLNRLFEAVGQNPKHRETNVRRVLQHKPQFLTRSELMVRAELQQTLDQIRHKPSV